MFLSRFQQSFLVTKSTMIPSIANSAFSSRYYNVTHHSNEQLQERKPNLVNCSLISPNLSIQPNVSSDLKPSFLHQTHQDEMLPLKHEEHSDIVRNQLKACGKEDSLMGLWLVDAIQRLGIDHHFRQEIDELMRRHYICTLSSKSRFSHSGPDSLLAVSLSFRLLRQEGYYVAPDVFNKFTDEKGKFNMKTVKGDIRALMELYEAAQLGVEGEDILEDAAKFSCQHLNAWAEYVDDNDASMIKNVLKHPYRKSLARFRSMNFKSAEFFRVNGLEESLQELSFVANYRAQDVRKQESLQVSKWWEDLGIGKKLEHARGEPLKWYPWPLPLLNDLSLSNERVALTKIISFIYLIDDIFDYYGEPEHLNLFSQSVKRWELGANEQLPDYMKECLSGLQEVTNEVAVQIQKKHGFNPIQSLRKTWEDLFSAFVVESRWINASSGSENLPKSDEYLQNAKVTSGVHVVLVHAFYLLGFGTNKSSITLDDTLRITSSVATIFRLWDDLGCSKCQDEGQMCHDGSYIDYYINEHEGVGAETARDHVFNMISDEWKRLNLEFLRLNRSSSSFQKASLNLLRMVPMMNDHNEI
ncbi:OLC1v1021849C3 [Oldenlandia corymbosa var. corymbosa]|uniref:OLC1v1021849C3 n=1 Tax=Oldenlandia corymbosa var. corymbosa TaxID=529605 RepID=A0AAV1BYV7_OLDCO|nr:OLC1v1021849C3 [Oldenlandia corymbosa var. corymbosa]